VHFGINTPSGYRKKNILMVRELWVVIKKYAMCYVKTLYDSLGISFRLKVLVKIKKYSPDKHDSKGMLILTLIQRVANEMKSAV
jgi:hypothetical protein